MASVLVARILGVILFVAFVMAGLVKLTPWIDQYAGHTQEEMTQHFKKFAKVSPLAKAGFHIDHVVYRNVVGALELTSAILMVLGGTGIISRLGNMMLILLMGGAVYTHTAVGDPWEQIVPATVLGSLLAIRLVLLAIPPADTGDKKDK